MPNAITSPVYVCQDNIDTDQIIPAQYLTLRSEEHTSELQSQ